MQISMKIPTRLNLLLFVSVSVGGCVAFAASLDDGDGSSNELSATATNQVKPSSTSSTNFDSHSKPEKSARTTSSTASERLMRELAKIQKSAIYKKGHYTVELVGDDLYEWRVNITTALLDEDCYLFEDLTRLREEGKRDTVELRVSFSADYPFAPPFVRVVKPVLRGFFMMEGGAICLELLSPNGWSSAYMAEAVIVQIALTISEGEVRVVEADDAKVAELQNLETAKRGFKKAMDTHQFDWNRRQ